MNSFFRETPLSLCGAQAPRLSLESCIVGQAKQNRSTGSWTQTTPLRVKGQGFP